MQFLPDSAGAIKVDQPPGGSATTQFGNSTLSLLETTLSSYGPAKSSYVTEDV
jgi:hypothetical protein